MLPRSEWQRAFKPRWSGEVKKVDAVEGGFVKAGNKRYAIARIQPVMATKPSTHVPAALAKGSEKRNETNRTEMREFVSALKTFLKDGSGVAPSAVGRHMNEKYGFQEKIKELRLGNATAFVRLYPEEFQITSGGSIQLRRANRSRVQIRLG